MNATGNYKIVHCECGLDFMTTGNITKCPICEQKKPKACCIVCHEEFEVSYYKAFCSMKCYVEFNKIDRICQTCGNTFKGYKNGKYCSSKCVPKTWKHPVSTCKRCGNVFSYIMKKGKRPRESCRFCRGKGYIRETKIQRADRIAGMILDVAKDKGTWFSASEIRESVKYTNKKSRSMISVINPLFFRLFNEGLLERKVNHRKGQYESNIHYLYRYKG